MLPTRLQNVVRPVVVQRNAYWVHPEAVLLAMVAVPHEGVRPSKLPIINFIETHYTELLEWEKLVTVPPLATDLADGKLQDICNQPLQIAAFLVNTVAVERAVKHRCSQGFVQGRPNLPGGSRCPYQNQESLGIRPNLWQGPKLLKKKKIFSRLGRADAGTKSDPFHASWGPSQN